MSATIKLLDNYKKICSVESDNACAKLLGVGRSAVSKWRVGEGHPSAETIVVMCKATGENPAHWLPLIEADRARTTGDRNAWLKLAQAAAALAGLYLVSRHGVDGHAAAAFVLSPVYIMRNHGCP